jgi:hypothetical protein
MKKDALENLKEFEETIKNLQPYLPKPQSIIQEYSLPWRLQEPRGYNSK